MNSVLRNGFALVAGVILGSLVNLAIVSVGPLVIPPPEGADLSTMEGLSRSIELFTPRHFVCPWLAHALGTLVGGWVAARLAASHRMKCAIVIGVFFLVGGITVVRMTGGPIGFVVADLALAYIPMSLMGGWLAVRGGASQSVSQPAS